MFEPAMKSKLKLPIRVVVILGELQQTWVMPPDFWCLTDLEVTFTGKSAEVKFMTAYMAMSTMLVRSSAVGISSTLADSFETVRDPSNDSLSRLAKHNLCRQFQAPWNARYKSEDLEIMFEEPSFNSQEFRHCCIAVGPDSSWTSQEQNDPSLQHFRYCYGHVHRTYAVEARPTGTITNPFAKAHFARVHSARLDEYRLRRQPNPAAPIRPPSTQTITNLFTQAQAQAQAHAQAHAQAFPHVQGQAQAQHQATLQAQALAQHRRNVQAQAQARFQADVQAYAQAHGQAHGQAHAHAHAAPSGAIGFTASGAVATLGHHHSQPPHAATTFATPAAGPSAAPSGAMGFNALGAVATLGHHHSQPTSIVNTFTPPAATLGHYHAHHLPTGDTLTTPAVGANAATGGAAPSSNGDVIMGNT
ncbi:MAG: Transcriptional activator flo8 [Chrysothrix sp. TS-e1954]|nr:MAG: Transcriptional activator flo8 [Chrysothrix sp. TS-e1954]